jgi:hypothetical protein
MAKNKKNLHEMKLMCKGDICIDEDGEVTVDLRDTDCDPDKAQQIIKTVVDKPGINWKMPSITRRKQRVIKDDD